MASLKRRWSASTSNINMQVLHRYLASLLASYPQASHPELGKDRDTIKIRIESALLSDGQLGVFVDYPWNDGSAKFSGTSNAPAKHTTLISTSVGDHNAEITHTLNEASFIASFDADAFAISRDSPDAQCYTILSRNYASTFQMAVTYGIVSPGEKTSDKATDTSSR
ncbi:uncharacterized protein ARMOST_07568 [Armillaria ostoyae]|uniref:Uncharacterized protein n=1 Tax=Armillaria ostoyae TaxID=47428 RepID=A0A284R659_ARMOS|nr:uncharacterized protein ARMOST_07568 [Armillaria ostoyae]